MKKQATFILLLLFFTQNIIGQDFHLSQYDAAPQFLNPALTGMYFGEREDFRFNANYRSQWKSLSNNAFTTAAIGYDMSTKMFGIGGCILNNKAGAGHYNSLKLLLSAAYEITSDETYQHNLWVGIQMGILDRGFDPSKLLSESQYSAIDGGFDPALDNREHFETTNIMRFDAGFGAYYKYRDLDKMLNPFLGFSIFNISKPNISFTTYESLLPIRFTLHGGTDININETIKLSPKFLLQQQAEEIDINLGLFEYYHLKNTIYDIILGLVYRNKDAIVVHAGLKQGRNIYRISYDINTSYLNNFSNGMGGIEFSIIYCGINRAFPSFK